jgi:hypothetical protein
VWFKDANCTVYSLDGITGRPTRDEERACQKPFFFAAHLSGQAGARRLRMPCVESAYDPWEGYFIDWLGTSRVSQYQKCRDIDNTVLYGHGIRILNSLLWDEQNGTGFEALKNRALYEILMTSLS